MPRPPRATDLYDLRVPLEVAISPDGERIALVVKQVNPQKDGYRTALWIVPSDGSADARQLTMGAKNENTPRWSPDGRTIAFLSDREGVLIKGGAGSDPALKEPPKEGGTQVWLLPMEGGEPRQLTRLPQDVSDMAWSPDGKRLCVVSGATRPEREKQDRKPGDPPERDAHLIDRLQYMQNGVGMVYKHPPKLWLVDVADGESRRLTGGASRDEDPVWSPDGKRVAFASNRHRDPDLTWRTDIYTVELKSGDVQRVSGGTGDREFHRPAYSRDGRWIAALGHRYTVKGTNQHDLWRFRATAESEGENLTQGNDLDAGGAMNSDLFGFGVSRPAWSTEGDSVLFGAPVEGSMELWRVRLKAGKVERLTKGRHYLSRFDAAELADGGQRVALMQADATNPPEVAVLDVPRADVGSRGERPRVLTKLMRDRWRDVEIVAPQERWHQSDGRRVQGWFYEAPRREGGPAPLVVQIHGGPATLYGWSLMWEWQCMVAQGMSVYACNPRGSQGYGQEFLSANFRNWGDGPMADIIAGVDSLIEDGLVDGDRLGVTGGSYGGYLTSWIVGHTDRFKAAVSARSVNDLASEMLTGDIAGPVFGRFEYGANPWEDPELYRAHSPLTYAHRIHTPLLIQHSEKDIRTPIGQAEELFTVLRSLRRPVRMLRVPEENHELTRGGAPFRRVENIERIGDWFRHFLVEGKRRLPPV
jgi:dipeptidyl aminopeptidase/acylaminoacyl peptidase